MRVISCVTVFLLLSVAVCRHEGETICHKLSDPNADFAFNLYRKLAKPDVKNVFFSPASITMALALLSMGARGNTHSQIFSTLNYGSLTQDQVNEAYKQLLHTLRYARDDLRIDIGNALALGEDVKLVPKYSEDAKHFYASEGFTVDFKDTTAAEAKLNQYIASKTDNKITDLVKGLSPATSVVIINYILFKGKWVDPFKAVLTYKTGFNVDKNTIVQVDMMTQTGTYKFYQDYDKHTSIIMLPYKGNASMMILLPDEGYMKELEAKVNNDYIKTWHDSLAETYLDLSMPKIKISAKSSLVDTLREMGMVDAFDTTADFSGISESPMKVSKIEHKAVLSVDEEGTEAAAATMVEIETSGPMVFMTLDRPFLLLIMESSTKSILFMGKISDPTAE